MVDVSCWRSRDERISDILLWTSSYGRAKAGRPARNYIQQLCEDTGCSPEDQPEAMNYREEWRERVNDIRAGGTTLWWWWWWWFNNKKNYWSNDHVWFCFYWYMINRLVWTSHLFSKFSENDSHTRQRYFKNPACQMVKIIFMSLSNLLKGKFGDLISWVVLLTFL